MKSSLRLVTAALAATSVASCFDVSTGRPAPILIDNFDSGDVLPADRYFDQWRCQQNDPPLLGDCHCDYATGAYQSPPYSLHLSAAVTETTDQGRNGAQLYTQAYVAEDLSRLSEIVFSVRLDQGDPPPPDARVDVELWCFNGDKRVTQSALGWRPHQWQTFALGLSRFHPLWGEIEGGPAACLAQVDSIHFSVNAGLPLGDQAKFDLYIDDIYFR